MAKEGRKHRRSWTLRLRQHIGSKAMEAFFLGAANAGRLHPNADPKKHGVEVIGDLQYIDDGNVDHRLDVYRPIERKHPLPALLYAHGGGFRMLSKETHWVMALAYARRGYCVFNINYRLSPKHRYPAALRDVCDAWRWVAEHAAHFGADADRLVVAGESAGANLITSATLASCFDRPEPWARALHELERTPRAVVAACGVYQVTDPGRFARRRSLPSWLRDRLEELTDVYLPDDSTTLVGGLDLADPVLLLESDVEPQRPLPPFFAPVGTKDPLLDDTRRLAAAIGRRGGVCEARYYPGEMHAFHAFVFREAAKRCWRETYAFLERHVPRG